MSLQKGMVIFGHPVWRPRPWGMSGYADQVYYDRDKLLNTCRTPIQPGSPFIIFSNMSKRFQQYNLTVSNFDYGRLHRDIKSDNDKPLRDAWPNKRVAMINVICQCKSDAQRVISYNYLKNEHNSRLKIKKFVRSRNRAFCIDNMHVFHESAKVTDQIGVWHWVTVRSGHGFTIWLKTNNVRISMWTVRLYSMCCKLLLECWV